MTTLRVAWVLALAAILSVPNLTHSATLGDDLVRNTVRLALAYYALAASLLLLLRSRDWDEAAAAWRIARWSWTLAWLAYLVHLAMAFHYYHHWSHADAVEHTRSVSGVGEGIYVSHLFTLLWSADVVSWWLRPHWYADRPAWIGRLLHCFMIFVIFNGTVVYETGPIRWAGLLLCGELLLLWVYRLRFSTASG